MATLNSTRSFKSIYVILTICILSLPHVLPANILFFFAGGNVSHKTTVWPWVLELAKRGHNVTFLSPHSKIPVPHPNITDLSAKPLQLVVTQVYQVDRFKERSDGVDKDFDYNQIALDTCKMVVNSRRTDPVLGSLFRDGSFDLIVINSLFGECGFYIAHYFKAKTIAYDSTTFITFFYDTYGVSAESAWIPDLIITFKNYPLAFWDRLYNNLVEYYWAWTRNYDLSPRLEEVARPLFKTEDLPTLYEMENNVSIVLLNTHVSTDFARTMPPLFVDVGGLGASLSNKEMPANFKDFMDQATHGVVLISFGSTIVLNNVRTRFQAMFFHLINESPNVRFIMRWSGPLPKFLDAQPKNLLVSEWLPQKEILAHPNLKILLTHGGTSSIQEATCNGVPMIVMPMFADQDYNAYRVEAQELGIRIEIRGMTEDSLLLATDKVLMNYNKYKKNMLKKQALFHDRPQSPVDTAVYWTEFALRHEDTIQTLRPANQHLNTFQRRLLDVHFFYAGVILLGLVFIVASCVVAVKLTLFTFRQLSKGGGSPSTSRLRRVAYRNSLASKAKKAN